MVEGHDLLQNVELTKQRQIWIVFVTYNVDELLKVWIMKHLKLAFDLRFINRDAVQTLIMSRLLLSLF